MANALDGNDIVAKLEDLLKQATTERSHYYVASCCREAIAEIMSLRKALAVEKFEHEFDVQQATSKVW